MILLFANQNKLHNFTALFAAELYKTLISVKCSQLFDDVK